MQPNLLTDKLVEETKLGRRRYELTCTYGRKKLYKEIAV